MPRLVGKNSSNGVLWSLTLLLLVVAGLGALEYKGYTNWVPELEVQRRPLTGGFGES